LSDVAGGGRSAGCRCCRSSSGAEPAWSPVPGPWNASSPWLSGRRQPASDRRQLVQERSDARRTRRRRPVSMETAGHRARNSCLPVRDARWRRAILLHSLLTAGRRTAVSPCATHRQRLVPLSVIMSQYVGNKQICKCLKIYAAENMSRRMFFFHTLQWIKCNKCIKCNYLKKIVIMSVIFMGYYRCYI